jgi:single-stranded-DNA-specific exonuclease
MKNIPDKWILRNPLTNNIHEQAINGYSHAFSRLLRSRGLNNQSEVEAFLNPSLKDLHDPFLMPGMEDAVKRLNTAIEKKDKIVIFGDYDADGIVSSVLIYNFLRALDINVDTYIPDRVKEGYDLGIDYLRSVTGKNDLIICVDCGTNNLQSQEYVRDDPKSPDVIACDHHKPTLDDYPEDDRYIIVNPKMPGSIYPFQELSGGGVTFKFLIAALRNLDKEKKKAFKSDYLNSLLDLVAVSTLADLMPLAGENRIMVKKGLDRIQSTSNHGLKTLIDISMPGIRPIGEYDIGFILAPRINAAGRVKDAIESFRLLSDDDTDDIRIAKDLDGYNIERQRLQGEIFQEIISRYELDKAAPGKKIFIASSSQWSEGVLGIVASDIVKTFNIPAILFRKRDDILKGSGRSIQKFGLHRSLLRLKDLFIRFGGHEHACGITMEDKNFEEFREKMSAIADNELSDDDLVRKYKYDIELSFNEMDIRLAEDLQMIRPFGKGNPGPSFVTRKCIVSSLKRLKEGKHVKLLLKKDGIILEGILFNIGENNIEVPSRGKAVDILYDLNINSWMGRRSLQLVIRDMFQKN